MDMPAVDNERKLRQAFSVGLNLPESEIDENFRYGSSAQWDSISHMALVAALDSTFDIMLDTDDLIDMSSYGRAREILTKYGVQF
jgi:acyl carrier protein